MGQISEADTANAVLAQITVRSAANLTPVIGAGRILRRFLLF